MFENATTILCHFDMTRYIESIFSEKSLGFRPVISKCGSGHLQQVSKYASLGQTAPSCRALCRGHE